MFETLSNSCDLAFELYEVLDAKALTRRPCLTEHSRETLDAALGTARDLAKKLFVPHNRKGDEHEPLYENGSATLIPGVKLAVDAFLDAGFLNATHSFEQGGMQLPILLSQACFAHFQATNVGNSAYPFLTMGVTNLIESFGSEEQKQRFLQLTTEGRFFDTMALTKPYVGSPLSDVRIRAESIADGSYRIKGNKTFISGGDHLLSENIVHMVLVKLPDAPPGVKGISLFIVPKFLVNTDDSLEPHNDVIPAGLFHKMGRRGITSTVLNLGNNGACVGYLMDKPHHGLACMFRVMNEACIGVGMGAVVLGYTGYLCPLEYARERPQGYLPDGKGPSIPQVTIIRHADMRHMLLTQEAYVEGAFDLGLYAARLFDDSQALGDDGQCHQTHELFNLLTPIVEPWPSEFCLKANELAIQILGGYGYTREYPAEQYYRGSRLNSIHEGTHGTQSLDLLGRKVGQNNGADLRQLTRLTRDACRRAGAHPSLAVLCQPLERLVARLSEATLVLLGDLVQSQVNQGLANSALYLKVFSHAMISRRWLEQATRAEEGLARGDYADAGFYRGKLQAARYFLTWGMPGCYHELVLLEARDDVCSNMQEE